MNLCVFSGNVTRDPELKHTQSGMAVCSFGLALNEKFKGKDGELKETVSFLDMECWGARAETIAEYVTKGTKLLVTCIAKQDRWEDAETGGNRSKVKFTVQNFEFCEKKRSEEDAEDEAPAEKPAPSSKKTRAAKPKQEKQSSEWDDEVPF